MSYISVLRAFLGLCVLSALTLVVGALRCARKRCKREELSRHRAMPEKRPSAQKARATGSSYYSIMDDDDDNVEINLAEDGHRKPKQKQGPSKRPTVSDSSGQSTPRSGQYPASERSDSSDQSDFSEASSRRFWN